MSTQTTSKPYDRRREVAFYDDRHDQAYMGDWPEEKKRKTRKESETKRNDRGGSEMCLFFTRRRGKP